MEAFASAGIQPDVGSVTQLVKVVDLQSFGNSILEFMIGKYTEGPQSLEERRKRKTNLRDLLAGLTATGGAGSSSTRRQTPKTPDGGAAPISVLGTIGLEALPLSWSKIPEIKLVTKIISMCLGPYNRNGDLRVDTSRVLSEISRIADQAYGNKFGFDQDSLIPAPEVPTARHLNRLRSAALNNKAVSLFMSLTDLSSAQTRHNIFAEMKSILNQALQISPENQVAFLNRCLASWASAEIRDD